MRSACGSVWYLAPRTHARCLRYPPNNSSAPIPDSKTLTPASRAAWHISTRIDGGWITDRFVENIHDPGEHVDDVRADLDLVQSNAEVCCHLAGVNRVVRHGLEPLILSAERDRIGLDRGFPVSGQRRNQARVEAATEKGCDWHIGHHVRCDSLLKDRRQIRGWSGSGGGGFLGGVPVAAGPAATVSPPLVTMIPAAA